MTQIPPSSTIITIINMIYIKLSKMFTQMITFISPSFRFFTFFIQSILKSFNLQNQLSLTIVFVISFIKTILFNSVLHYRFLIMMIRLKRLILINRMLSHMTRYHTLPCWTRTYLSFAYRSIKVFINTLSLRLWSLTR